MMNGEDKFDYSYSAPTEGERREIESIKRQYEEKPEKQVKLELLRKLNRRVRMFPSVISVIVGIAGTLVLGTGMTMVLEWNVIAGGVAVGIAGIAIAAVAYPLYKTILKYTKRKYGQQILNLSNELLNKEN